MDLLCRPLYRIATIFKALVQCHQTKDTISSKAALTIIITFMFIFIWPSVVNFCFPYRPIIAVS